MTISHKIDSFLYSIFHVKDENDLEALENAIVQYYTVGPFKPTITLDNEWAHIEIDTLLINDQKAEYDKAINYCDKGNYGLAKPILEALVKKNPTNSEYYRVLGQIKSDEGDSDKAIDYLIDALRWDPKNAWALIMMGNVFAREKNDVETASKYYDQALKVKPDDFIAVNNIAANLMHQGKREDAKKYFSKSITINEKYPNAHYGLSLIAEQEGDFNSSFLSASQTLKLSKTKDALYFNAYKQLNEIAQKIVTSNDRNELYETYKTGLEEKGKKRIKISEDTTIPTAAKFEFAENHGRSHHIIKFNPSFISYAHLIMHELVHLDFALSAQEQQENQLFVTNQSHKRDFKKKIEPTLNKLKNKGYAPKTLESLSNNLFEGLNRQVYNTPIDLFIEDLLYNEHEELRPYQYLSLTRFLSEGIEGTTNKKYIDLSPDFVLSASKIYNMVSALQYRDLFGIDVMESFKPTKSETNTAIGFYNEYLEYKENKEPGEEYELIQHWGNDLKLENYFQLIKENDFRESNSNIGSLLSSIEEDPFGLNLNKATKEREMEKFQKSHDEMGTNMAVVMYMVDALQYFKDMSIEKIKAIAFEIAMQGTQGYNPDKEGYNIGSIPNKTFTGYHILSYYYVSWARALPEMLEQLRLPYEDEYKMALQIQNI